MYLKNMYLGEKGPLCFLKDWQFIAAKIVWNTEEGEISRETWVKTSAQLEDKTISRASIINFLEGMTEDGFFTKTDRSGKGGMHGVYSPAEDVPNVDEFMVKMKERVLANLPP